MGKMGTGVNSTGANVPGMTGEGTGHDTAGDGSGSGPRAAHAGRQLERHMIIMKL